MASSRSSVCRPELQSLSAPLVAAVGDDVPRNCGTCPHPRNDEPTPETLARQRRHAILKKTPRSCTIDEIKWTTFE